MEKKMTTQSEIRKWQEKLKQEKLKRDFREFVRKEEERKRQLKREYLQLKYEKPISAGKGVFSGLKKVGKGFMSGINEIQKFNSRQAKRK